MQQRLFRTTPFTIATVLLFLVAGSTSADGSWSSNLFRLTTTSATSTRHAEQLWARLLPFTTTMSNNNRNREDGGRWLQQEGGDNATDVAATPPAVVEDEPVPPPPPSPVVKSRAPKKVVPATAAPSVAPVAVATAPPSETPPAVVVTNETTTEEEISELESQVEQKPLWFKIVLLLFVALALVLVGLAGGKWWKKRQEGYQHVPEITLAV